MFLNIASLSKGSQRVIKRSFDNNELTLRQDEFRPDWYIINLHATVEVFTLIRALNEAGFSTVKMIEDNCFNRIVTVLK